MVWTLLDEENSLANCVCVRDKFLYAALRTVFDEACFLDDSFCEVFYLRTYCLTDQHKIYAQRLYLKQNQLLNIHLHISEVSSHLFTNF